MEFTSEQMANEIRAGRAVPYGPVVRGQQIRAVMRDGTLYCASGGRYLVAPQPLPDQLTRLAEMSEGDDPKPS